MNWQEVIDKYSKIYEMLKKHIKSSHRDCLDVCCEEGELYIINARGDYIFQDRELYDFFDEQGIIIEIGVDWTAEPKYCYRVIKDYWGDDRQRKWGDLFYKRTEAEEAAFQRAFEILEQKLKEAK